MKKTQQTYIDNLKTLEKALIEGEKGIIKDIAEITNKQYFKTESTFEEKKGIVITIMLKNAENNLFTQWMSIPEMATGISKSNIYAFKKKYGFYPEIGKEVDVVIDENGFFKIDF